MFTFNELRKQLADARSPGVIQRMMAMMPGMGELRKMMQNKNVEKEIGQQIGIIDSMTPSERCNSEIITPSRLNRIARGAGVQVTLVNELIKSFDVMVPLMKRLDERKYRRES